MPAHGAVVYQTLVLVSPDAAVSYGSMASFLVRARVRLSVACDLDRSSRVYSRRPRAVAPSLATEFLRMLRGDSVASPGISAPRRRRGSPPSPQRLGLRCHDSPSRPRLAALRETPDATPSLSVSPRCPGVVGRQKRVETTKAPHSRRSRRCRRPDLSTSGPRCREIVSRCRRTSK